MLQDPVLEGDLTYTIKSLEGEMPEKAVDVSVFIDVIGMPLTPVSYAGAASGGDLLELERVSERCSCCLAHSADGTTADISGNGRRDRHRVPFVLRGATSAETSSKLLEVS